VHAPHEEPRGGRILDPVVRYPNERRQQRNGESSAPRSGGGLGPCHDCVLLGVTIIAAVRFVVNNKFHVARLE
jgi:hypothetical protein